jgi:hypothetical protein
VNLILQDAQMDTPGTPTAVVAEAVESDDEEEIL